MGTALGVAGGNHVDAQDSRSGDLSILMNIGVKKHEEFQEIPLETNIFSFTGLGCFTVLNGPTMVAFCGLEPHGGAGGESVMG